MAMTAPLAAAPLAADVTIDSTTWAALALVLTLIGLALSWVSWRRRGPAAGLRGLAWTLVPVAAWLTGTLKLAVAVIEDVLNWATKLVFSPVVWTGVVVAGVAVLLWFVSGLMLARGIGVRGGTKRVRSKQTAGEVVSAPTGRPGKPVASKKAPRRGKNDDDLEDMDDIEAILKKHGI
jgi:hypothetical protein